jgi:2-polyprenyl-3-methyl-5-hydroxy-6-metoxy-1,4-benzoquinol methylase
MITWDMIKNRWNRTEVYSKPDFWDHTAEKYYRDTGFNLWTNPHLNELYHRLESDVLHGWATDVTGTRILDLGCGAGRFAREFAKRGATVTGMDFSPKSVAIARRMTTEPSVSYSVGSVFDLDVNGAYDWIVCAKVLGVACKDASELRICLKKMRRALKPGGRFLSVEMCHTTFVRRVLKMSYDDFKKELAAAGFEIIDSKTAEFIPARLALAFFELPYSLTKGVFSAGEFFVKYLPFLSDQKFTLARRV